MQGEVRARRPGVVNPAGRSMSAVVGERVRSTSWIGIWEDQLQPLGELVRYCDDLRRDVSERKAAGRAKRLGGPVGDPRRLEPDAASRQDPRGATCGMAAGLRLPGLPQCGMVRVADVAVGETGVPPVAGRAYGRCSGCRASESKRSRRRGHRLPEPVESLVAELNSVLRGWGAYFRVATPQSAVRRRSDSYVRERLALFLSKRGKRRRAWAGGDPGTQLTRHLGAVRDAWWDRTTRRDRWSGDGNAEQRRGERPRKAVCGRTACTV